MSLVPTLDELATDPGKVATLPLETVEALLGQCAVAQGALIARLLASRAGGNGQPEAADGDRLLTVEQAAEKLNTPTDWLYRRADKLPFTVRLGPRQLRFSARGIERYIRQRLGR